MTTAAQLSATPAEIFMMSRAFIPSVLIVAIGVLIGQWDDCKYQLTLIKLIDYIFLPCLVFSAIHKHPFDGRELMQIGSAVTAMLALACLIAWLCMRGQAGWRRSNLVAPSFMSSGTLLLPLSYALFGYQGLAKAIYFHLFVLFWFHTLGAYLLTGSSSLKQFVRIPSLHVALILSAAVASPLSVPDNLQEFAWLAEKGIDITALGALPLLLINFGYPLGRLSWSSARRGVVGGSVRVLAGPLVAFALVFCYRNLGWLGMERGYDMLAYINLRTTEAVLVLGAALPSSHYALRLGRGGELAAGDIDSGTLLCSLLLGIFSVACVLFLINALIFHD